MIHYAESAVEDPSSPIQCVWELRADVRGVVQRIVTDARPEIAFHLGENFEQRAANGQWYRQARGVLAGQITTPVLLRSTGETHTVGVRLRPWVLGMVSRTSAVQLTDGINDLDCFGTLRQRLEGVLTTPFPELAQRVAMAFSGLLPKSTRLHGFIAAVEFAEKSEGKCTVGQLAQRCGVGIRQLERLFLRELGVGPKMFLRMVRFRTVFQHLGEEKSDWADTSAACGYADQSHLTRDFQQFAGCAPAAALAPDAALALQFTAAPR